MHSTMLCEKKSEWRSADSLLQVWPIYAQRDQEQQEVELVGRARLGLLVLLSSTVLIFSVEISLNVLQLSSTVSQAFLSC